MAMVGEPGKTPPLLRVSLGDMYTGIHGVAAVCAALLGRVKSGKGQHIDLSLYDCLVSIHDYAVQCYTLSGGQEIPQQTGHDMPQSTLYGVFTASDGHLVIAAQVDDAWKRFARLIGGEALAADARFHTADGRNRKRVEILALAKAWVQSIDEVLADPQIQARNMVIEQDHPLLGKIRLPNLPFRFSGFGNPVPSVAPRMGQDNRAIAGELGFSAAEIDRMESEGVLYSEPMP